MRRVIATLALGTALVAVMSGTRVNATIPPVLPFGPSYFGPGPLTCGSTTYIVTEHGFGADIHVVGSTTVLIFRAYGPLPPASPTRDRFGGCGPTHAGGFVPTARDRIPRAAAWAQ